MKRWLITVFAIVVFVISLISLNVFINIRNYLNDFHKKEIFSDVKITEENYEFGGFQEDSWSGWVEHDPEVLKKKVQDGIWVISDYFHEQKEYGNGNEFYEGIEEFKKKYPKIKPEDLIFMTMEKQTLSRGEVRCVTNKNMTHSFIYFWGRF